MYMINKPKLYIKHLTEYEKRIYLNEVVNNTYSYLNNLVEEVIVDEFEYLKLITN